MLRKRAPLPFAGLLLSVCLSRYRRLKFWAGPFSGPLESFSRIATVFKRILKPSFNLI